MDSLARALSQRIGAHLGADPLIRASDHADFQANGALAAARERHIAPRDLATAVAAAIVDDDLIVGAEAAGPGFVNLTVAPTAIWDQTARRHAAPGLGVATPLVGRRVVVEYSGPNIAKELHVGHLRSTVVGDALARRAREIGIGAVKYADLSTGRIRDYVFDLDRMLALDGNTAIYLQYAHARTCSILRKAEGVPRTVHLDAPIQPAERRLALRLDEFDAVLAATVEQAEPHRLCGYLFDVAQALAGFWSACPVLGAPSDSVRANRLVLCDLTARTLRTGLGLLGVAAPERL